MHVRQVLCWALGRRPHSYGNVAAVGALGHEEANVWELWGKLQMIPSLRKMYGALLEQGCFVEDQRGLGSCPDTGIGTVQVFPPAAQALNSTGHL